MSRQPSSDHGGGHTISATTPIPLPPGHSVVHTFPTNSGRAVQSVRGPDGELVLIKRAFTAHWAQELDEQVRHFSVVGGLADQPLYPEVLRHEPHLLVLRHYAGGSLDDLSMYGPQHEVAQLAAEALRAHVTTSMKLPAGWAPDDAWRAHAQQYLVVHARSRLDRLVTALAALPEWADTARRAGLPSRREELAEATRWVLDRETALVRLAPPVLRVAVHGDLGLNNVLLDHAGDPRRVVFIDTRGWWHDGVPWWDPMMDYATLIVFHCRIEPALSTADPTIRQYHAGTGRLDEPLLRSLVTDAVLAGELAVDDAHWQQRLEVEIAVRLLGSIGVQLLTAPANALLRADAVLDLYLDQARLVEGLLDDVDS